MLGYFSMFVGLTLTAAIAHLIARRAEDHGRRYWIWFLLGMPLGPPGALIAFLLLEASIRKEREGKAAQNSAGKVTK